MSLINHEELEKQLASGELTSLDDITKEFKNILKEVIQTALQEELSSHLGYDKHQESNTSNSRNGYNEKTIKSKYGQFDVSIPRDRDSSFEPQLVKKREVLLDGSEDLILSLYTKGMSVRDIQLHLDDLYGYELSTQTISNITEKVIEKANEWQSRPLDAIYPIIFMDCRMPIMDGFDATLEIRKLEAADLLTQDAHKQRIAIIALTANTSSADKEMCLRAGMDDYICKPYQALDFQKALNNYLYQS